ncbi:CACTA en-spm transposon protein [Cucumis melo var. makuwa]|uniref:CACTA en-spm transposon protein n=1 Tax=Cucumis melo var. makuwa TaxID=1194695 RepID=A0A5A7TYG0_CUCMM|nr:CACTA en-spm transposon protein [Cucumis melo var. makuwa]TYK27158.1 CACTA en-spm transposon protein [Cucumis melo var. makuwa]
MDEHIGDDTLCTMSLLNGFHELDDLFLELDVSPNARPSLETLVLPKQGVRETRPEGWEDSNLYCPRSKEANLSTCFRFSNTIGVYVRDIANQALIGFVEHKMSTSFKEFRGDCHRNFKKYNDHKQARANLLYKLEQPRTNKVAIEKQPYNHSSGFKSFLQRKHELTEERGQLVVRVELFKETLPIKVSNSFHRLPQTHITKCWNYCLHPPQYVLNHSLGTRYVRPFWVDDRATQKVLVGTLSPSHGRVVAILRVHILKKCTLERLWN